MSKEVPTPSVSYLFAQARPGAGQAAVTAGKVRCNAVDIVTPAFCVGGSLGKMDMCAGA
jgi:hypothetical protein